MAAAFSWLNTTDQRLLDFVAAGAGCQSTGDTHMLWFGFDKPDQPLSGRGCSSGRSGPTPTTGDCPAPAHTATDAVVQRKSRS